MKTKMKKARKIFAVVLSMLLFATVLSFSVGAVETDSEGVHVFSNPVFSIQSYEQWNDDGSRSALYIGGDGINQYTMYINIYQLFRRYSELRRMTFDLVQLDSTGSHNILIIGDGNSNYQEIAIYRDNVEVVVLNSDNILTGILLIPFQDFVGYGSSDLIEPAMQILNNGQYTTYINDTEFYYGLGFTNGVEFGRAENETGSAGAQLIFSVVEAPFNVLRQMLSFDILGVNVFGLVMSLFTLCLIAAVIRFLL